jgi:hypothetical protein
VLRLPKWGDSMTCHNFDHTLESMVWANLWSSLKAVNFDGAGSFS